MGKDPDELRSEIGETRKRLGDKMDQIKSAITGSIPDPGDVQTGAMNFMDAVRRNPLGLFFGMAAAGFIIGSLVPITSLEDEQLAPMVGQMRERARNRVQSTLAAARDAAVSSFSDAMGGNA